MRNNLHDTGSFGVVPESPDLLAEMRTRETSAPSPVVDFTFRLPPELLDEIKALARDENCSANAMVAHLVDVGLQQRGRPGIVDRYPEYVHYLNRRKRRDA